MHNAFMVPISLFGCLIFTDNWSTYVDTVTKNTSSLKEQFLVMVMTYFSLTGKPRKLSSMA